MVMGGKNEALPPCNGNGPLTAISLFGEASPNDRRLKNIRTWFVHGQHGFSHWKKRKKKEEGGGEETAEGH